MTLRHTQVKTHRHVHHAQNSAQTRRQTHTHTNTQTRRQIQMYTLTDYVYMKSTVFGDITSCGSCQNQLFGRTNRLQYQGDENRSLRNNVNSN
jgi:hypothetical protein